MRDCGFPGCHSAARARGYCWGHYKRWLRTGDPEPVTAEARFFGHVTEHPATGCWLWNSPNAVSGYGLFQDEKRTYPAHRWAYEFLRADIPDGLHLDHLCRIRACVNPWHLEPVTCRENLLRGETLPAANAAKTRCHRGHPFDTANTYVDPRGKRECRTCRREADARAHSRRLVGTASGG